MMPAVPARVDPATPAAPDRGVPHPGRRRRAAAFGLVGALLVPLPAAAAPTSCDQALRYAAQSGAQLLRIDRLDLGPAGRSGKSVADIGVGDTKSALVAQTVINAAALGRILDGGPEDRKKLGAVLQQTAPPTEAEPATAATKVTRVGPFRLGAGELSVRAQWEPGMACGKVAGEATRSTAGLSRLGVLEDEDAALVRVPGKISSLTTTAIEGRGPGARTVAAASLAAGEIELLSGAVTVRIVRPPSLQATMSGTDGGEVRYRPATIEVSGEGFESVRLDAAGDGVELRLDEDGNPVPSDDAAPGDPAPEDDGGSTPKNAGPTTKDDGGDRGQGDAAGGRISKGNPGRGTTAEDGAGRGTAANGAAGLGAAANGNAGRGKSPEDGAGRGTAADGAAGAAGAAANGAAGRGTAAKDGAGRGTAAKDGAGRGTVSRGGRTVTGGVGEDPAGADGGDTRTKSGQGEKKPGVEDEVFGELPEVEALRSGTPLPAPSVPGLPVITDPGTETAPASGPGTTIRISLGDVRQAVAGHVIAAKATAMTIGVTQNRAGLGDSGQARRGTVLDMNLGLLEVAAVAPEPAAPAPAPSGGGGSAGLPITGPRVDVLALAGLALLIAGAAALIYGMRGRTRL